MAGSNGNGKNTNRNSNGGGGPDDAKRADELLREAGAEGTLSAEGLATLALVDPGAEIAAGLGVCVEDVPASEVVLVTLLVDDSGSIGAASNEAAVREGHNLVLEALGRTAQRDGILVHTRYLNGKVLSPYCPVEHAARMDGRNYRPDGGTPLFDQTVVVLGTVVAKAQELGAAGVAVRTVTLVITDGADEHSTRCGAREVAALVGDMRRAESHIVAAMGISDGSTDFRAVFRSMGIEDRWILTPGASQADLRRAFQIFSQSAVRASQPAVYAKSLGGFAN